MKWLKDRYHNTKLSLRLAIPIAVVLLAMLSLFNWILYGYASKAVFRTLSDSVSSTLIRAESYMDMRLKSLLERMLYLRLDSSVDRTLSNYLLSEEPVADAVTASEMTRTLSLYRASESLSTSLLLYTPKGVFQADGFSVADDFDFSSSDLIQVLQQQPGPMVFAPAQRDHIFISHRMVIPAMYRFRITGSSEECVIIINIDQNKLTGFLKKILPGDGSDICIVDSSGAFITCANSEACQELVDREAVLSRLRESDTPVEITLTDQKYYAAACQLNCAPWTLIYLQSERQIQSELNQLKTSFTVVTVLVIAILIYATFRISGTVTTPLKDFCVHIRGSREKNQLDLFPYMYQDEIGTLAQAYNNLLLRVHALLDEQKAYIVRLQDEKDRADTEQKLKRRAELKALQAQINPHFLYNTLDSIRWKAEKIGAEDIVQMTTSLATLFRISLSRGQEMISIEQEARHVLSYLQIQKQRYGEKLNYFFDIAPEAFSLYTVKLVLQPLVENAIYHGIKEAEGSGEIGITIRAENDRVIMRVTDNGLGIPEERLKLLQAGLERGISVNSDGYGIFNVNERLRLHFGKSFGLELQSKWGEGTIATLTMPRITEERAGDYVSDTDCG